MSNRHLWIIKSIILIESGWDLGYRNDTWWSFLVNKVMPGPLYTDEDVSLRPDKHVECISFLMKHLYGGFLKYLESHNVYIYISVNIVNLFANNSLFTHPADRAALAFMWSCISGYTMPKLLNAQLCCSPATCNFCLPAFCVGTVQWGHPILFIPENFQISALNSADESSDIEQRSKLVKRH